jgi:hypothetical protein
LSLARPHEGRAGFLCPQNYQTAFQIGGSLLPHPQNPGFALAWSLLLLA